MIIYVITFLVSLLFFNIAYSYKDEKNHFRKIFIMIALLIPCLIAGLRATSVGTDTSGYIIKLFNLASRTDGFSAFCSLSKLYFDIQDYAYLFITYAISKKIGSFSFFLFFIELLVILPVFFSLVKTKKSKNDIIIGMTVFYLFMYNVSFNMARQSIASSFLILGLTYLGQNKKVKSILLLLISIMFHQTAMFGILIYMCYLFIKSNRFTRTKKIILSIVIMSSILLVIQYNNIISFLHTYGIYTHGILYIKRFSGWDFSFTDTFVYLFILLMLYFNKENLKKKNIDYKFYLFISIESVIVLQLGAFVQYMERLSLYLLYPILINAIPYIGTTSKRVTKNTVALIMFLIIYWLYIFVYLKSHGTIPYSFS